MKIGELFYEVAFKADQMKLNDFIKSIGQINMKSLLSVGGLGVLINQARKIVDEVSDASISLNKFGRETGLSREEVQKWGKAAEIMGVSAETVAGDMRNLQRIFFRIMEEGDTSGVWDELGISPDQDPSKTLIALANALSRFNIGVQQGYLERLGLSQEWLNIFPEILKNEAFLTEQMVLTNEELDKIEKYHKAQVRLSQVLKKLQDDIAVPLAENAAKLLEGLNAMLQIVEASKEWKETLEFVAEALDRIFSKNILKHSIEGWKLIGQGIKQYANPLDGIKIIGNDIKNAALWAKNQGVQKLGNMATTVNIMVTGAKAPELVAEEIKKAIDRTNSDAFHQISPGSF